MATCESWKAHHATLPRNTRRLIAPIGMSIQRATPVLAYTMPGGLTDVWAELGNRALLGEIQWQARRSPIDPYEPMPGDALRQFRISDAVLEILEGPNSCYLYRPVFKCSTHQRPAGDEDRQSDTTNPQLRPEQLIEACRKELLAEMLKNPDWKTAIAPEWYPESTSCFQPSHFPAQDEWAEHFSKKLGVPRDAFFGKPRKGHAHNIWKGCLIESGANWHSRKRRSAKMTGRKMTR